MDIQWNGHNPRWRYRSRRRKNHQNRGKHQYHLQPWQNKDNSVHAASVSSQEQVFLAQQEEFNLLQQDASTRQFYSHRERMATIMAGFTMLTAVFVSMVIYGRL